MLNVRARPHFSSDRANGLIARSTACRSALLSLLIVLIVAGALSCGRESAGAGVADAVEVFRGRVIDVVADSLLEMKSLTVEAEDDVRMTFEVRGKRVSGFTPSHVREHMVLGLLVSVTFHRENGAYVLDDLTD